MIDLVRHFPELNVEKYYICFQLFKIEKHTGFCLFVLFCFVLQLLWPPEVFLSVHFFSTISQLILNLHSVGDNKHRKVSLLVLIQIKK